MPAPDCPSHDEDPKKIRERKELVTELAVVVPPDQEKSKTKNPTLACKPREREREKERNKENPMEQGCPAEV